MLPTAFLLLGLSSGVASAAEARSLRYTLAVDGQPVGYRQLDVKYLPAESGEVRLLESWTELSVEVAGQTLSYRQRLAGQGGIGGFDAVIDEAGHNREIQAVRAPHGWIVTIAEGGEAKTWEHPPDAFLTTSLGLIDPDATLRLSDRTTLKVLTAETGEILSGGLSAPSEVKIQVGDKLLPATEYVWTLPEGPVRLAYGPQGHMLRYTMRVMGREITATLDTPPEARNYNTVMDGPMIKLGPGLEETEL